MACNLQLPAILFQGDSIAKSVGSEEAEEQIPSAANEEFFTTLFDREPCGGRLRNGNQGR